MVANHILHITGTRSSRKSFARVRCQTFFKAIPITPPLPRDVRDSHPATPLAMIWILRDSAKFHVTILRWCHHVTASVAKSPISQPTSLSDDAKRNLDRTDNTTSMSLSVTYTKRFNGITHSIQARKIWVCCESWIRDIWWDFLKYTYMHARPPSMNVILPSSVVKFVIDCTWRCSQMWINPRNRSLLDRIGERRQPSLGLPFIRVWSPQRGVSIGIDYRNYDGGALRNNNLMHLAPVNACDWSIKRHNGIL